MPQTPFNSQLSTPGRKFFRRICLIARQIEKSRFHRQKSARIYLFNVESHFVRTLTLRQLMEFGSLTANIVDEKGSERRSWRCYCRISPVRLLL